jgi:hypothetical protein
MYYNQAKMRPNLAGQDDKKDFTQVVMRWSLKILKHGHGGSLAPLEKRPQSAQKYLQSFLPLIENDALAVVSAGPKRIF